MTLSAVELTPDQLAALDVARALAAGGVPVFVAPPDPRSASGFALPVGWQRTAPDPAVVDRWAPGMALCAVMGHGLDLIDIDPRNGGDRELSALGCVPRVYGRAQTPSGGEHMLIASLGVGSRDGILPGVDLKGGRPDGGGRGFAFIAPTSRASKVDGVPRAYQWVTPPAGWRDAAGDTSGAVLADRVRAALADRAVRHAGQGGPEWWRTFVTSREPQAAAAAERAIRVKLDEVAAWQAHPGTNFRTVLLRAAMTLGGYVGGGHLDEADAWVRLEAAVAAVWGTPDADDRRWIAQGLTDGAAQPFHVYTPADEAQYGAAAQAVAAQRSAPPWSPYRALGAEEFDPGWAALDQELAEAVMGRCAPVLRYAADAGTWLVRESVCWRERGDLSGWAVAVVARLMPPGLTPVPRDVAQRTPEHWQAVRRQRLMSSGGAGAVERKLRAIVSGGEHPGALELAELDTEPEVLWAGGQPWDLRACAETPTVAALDPATPHMRTAAVAPDARETPVWDRFVATVWPDAELRAWALRVLAVSLAGYPDAALPVLYGPERTGKTSLVALLVRVLGSYAHAADPRLLSGADATHASVVYALKGRRLSFIDEGPRRGHLAAERLKQLTGGGQLTGNAMRANPVTFAPTHTLVMTTNDEPPITDPALRARMRVIPCEADQEAVRAARQALTAAVWEVEGPGVLAALMRECAGWLGDPASALPDAAPAAQRGRVDDMAAGQDPVRTWVQTCTVPAEPGTPGRDLYVAFVRWFAEHPLYRRATAPSETLFGRSLTGQGFAAVKMAGAWLRPLSVLGGPSGVMPWEPLPSPHMTPGSGGFWRVSGGFLAGSDGQPATPDQPRSEPVLPVGLAGLAGSFRTMNNEKEVIHQKSDTDSATAGNTGLAANPPETTLKKTPDLGLAGSGQTRQKPANPADEAAGDVDLRATRKASVSSRSVSKRDAADRAYQGQRDKVVTKAEARRQLAEERRQAAVRDASGDPVGLPAVVDRAGSVLPVTAEQAEAVVRTALDRSGALTVDVETSGYPLGHRLYALRSVQLGDAEAAVVLDPHAHAELIRGLLAAAPRLHAHSATADLVPLAHAGLVDAEQAWARMYDTVIPAKLADPQSTGSDPGLKQLAEAVLGPGAVAPAADQARAALFRAGKWLTIVKVDTPAERSGWTQVQPGCATMLRYAASDVLDTAALARALPQPDAAVAERERLVQRMTARVTHRGVRIDAEHVRTLIERHTADRDEAAARVRAFDVDNPGSDQQVGATAAQMGAELPLTATGRPSVAEGVLDPLRRTQGPLGAFVAAVLDYRHHDTVLGTFLAPYHALCVQGDGRARPTVYTLGTDTGRMSCVRPNLQQLPREGGVRACITADPGWLMIGADFSGVELRVAAALSQDPTLLSLIAEGRDLHAEVARQVWGPDATKAHRYTAKRIVFGRLYGGGIATLARQAGVDQGTAQAAVDSLDALTPQLAAWSASIRDAVRHGATRFPSYSGRTIHLPQEYPHKGPNYCIQGSARELLVDALVRWRDTRWGSCTVLPVHDELDVFVPEAEAHDASAELVRCMEGELYGVRIVAEPSAPAFAWQDST